MATLEAILAAGALSCSGDGPVPRTDAREVRVSYDPIAVRLGSELNVRISGLGQDRVSLFLLRTSDVYEIGALFKAGNLALLGIVDQDAVGDFEGTYTISESLPASGGTRMIAIEGGSWTLAVGTTSSVTTFGQLEIKAR